MNTVTSKRKFLHFIGLLSTYLITPYILHPKLGLSEELLDETNLDPSLSDETGLNKVSWMAEIFSKRALKGPLHLMRFVEPIYVVTQPIAWKPNSNQLEHKSVSVPIGFVTDLASIPRIFWAVIKPDDEYTYAAIIHDYLYWDQKVTREEADNILKYAMEDLQVSSIKIAAIYNAVRLAGESSWTNNQKLKSQGEKRILRNYPDNPITYWKDWRKEPLNFATPEAVVN